MDESLATRPYDVDLFVKLNEEYRDKPIVTAPRKFDPASMLDQAQRRAAGIDRRLDIRGKRVLEIGCARGDLPRVLADGYGCEVVGVDIREYNSWSSFDGRGVRFLRRDIAREPYDDLGQFDAIVSLAVFEHLSHPYAMLKAVRDLLAPGGRAYIAAQLYRGPKASHRYREVFFPWPHLLFTDEVFTDFYRTHHGREQSAAWVNKLTYLHYVTYFQLVGLREVHTWLTPSTPAFDGDFYRRFYDRLSRYPKFDLSYDFVYTILSSGEPAEAPTPGVKRPPDLTRRVAELEREVRNLRSSTSWKLTAPLRETMTAVRRLRRRSSPRGRGPLIP